MWPLSSSVSRMLPAASLQCRHCSKPVSVWVTDFLPGPGFPHDVICEFCKLRTRVPAIPSVVSTAIGLLGGASLGRIALLQAEAAFGTPVSLGLYALIFVATLYLSAAFVVLAARVLFGLR